MARYQIEVRHPELGKYRCLTGSDIFVLEQRATALKAQWDEQWRIQTNKEAARKETLDAEAQLNEIRSILTLGVNAPINWESLKRRDQFPEPAPAYSGDDEEPFKPLFMPQLTWIDWLIPGRRSELIREGEQRFARATSEWQERQERARSDFERRRSEWHRRRESFESEKLCQHRAIDAFKVRYHGGDVEEIEEYVGMVLRGSKYPSCFPQQFLLQYQPASRLMVVEYELPSPGALPRLKEVKWSQDGFKRVLLSDREANALFDAASYQTILRTAREIFSSDQGGFISQVVLNGWICYQDVATGRDTEACILSLQASKQEFMEINLERVEPERCFRALKGISAGKLHGLSPVAPILRMTRSDPRFVANEAIIADLEEGANLATMEWVDFEHLIREVFEAQFLQTSGEVRVTRASRDGGVDAVVFDPDPIRGGKIIIQAKRYTNPVGMSAVRELYGTVVNEGAIKGILVTTSTYGPDAFKFAKDKPITLIDGNNLLHLMTELGHKVRINIKEAKERARG